MFYAAARAHTHTQTHPSSTHTYERSLRGANEARRTRTTARSRGSSSRTQPRTQESRGGATTATRTTRTTRLGGVWCCRPCSACNYLMALAFSAAVVLHLALCNKLSYQVSLMYTPSAPGRPWELDLIYKQPTQHTA